MRRAWLLILAVLALALMAPNPRVAFLHPTRITTSQAEVAWLVRVEPNPENRALMVAAIDSDCIGSAEGCVVRRSDEQLDGASAPRTRVIQWGRLPAGSYTVLAAVSNGSKVIAKANVSLIVVCAGLCL